MRGIWIADASPIILLSRTGLADVLLQLPEKLIIPAAVVSEVRSEPARAWITEHADSCVQQAPPDPECEGFGLGSGETTVLAVGRLHPSSTLLLDDQAARRVAISLGLAIKGTAGILVMAKRSGLIAQVRPVLQQLVEGGYRASPLLLRRTLAEAGE